MAGTAGSDRGPRGLIEMGAAIYRLGEDAYQTAPQCLRLQGGG